MIKVGRHKIYLGWMHSSQSWNRTTDICEILEPIFLEFCEFSTTYVFSLYVDVLVMTNEWYISSSKCLSSSTVLPIPFWVRFEVSWEPLGRLTSLDHDWGQQSEIWHLIHNPTIPFVRLEVPENWGHAFERNRRYRIAVTLLIIPKQWPSVFSQHRWTPLSLIFCFGRLEWVIGLYDHDCGTFIALSNVFHIKSLRYCNKR